LHYVNDDKLEDLELHYVNDDKLRSLVQFSPNLIHFGTRLFGVKAQTADDFCASFPNLQTLKFTWVDFPFGNLGNFWNLSWLKSLILVTSGEMSKTVANDAFLKKIPDSFPLLEKLHLCFIETGGDGISAIAKLENLHSLALVDRNGMEIDVNALTDCFNLRHLRMPMTPLSAISFFALVRSCWQLDYIEFRTIDVNDSKKVNQMMKNFAGLGPRKLAIGFANSKCMEPWISKRMKMALRHLKRSAKFEIEIMGK